MSMRNPVETVLERDEADTIAKTNDQLGPAARIVATYNPDTDSLLGFVLDMSYDEATIVTCDAWKLKCGGVPKNSFVIIKLSGSAGRPRSAGSTKLAVILARVLEAVPTPLSNEIQQTIFSIHKVQAVPDPYTSAELQWGALKVAILGTYYDDDDGGLVFGNDIDTYMSPHFYEVYVPLPDDLDLLVNTFVCDLNPIVVGVLRYTETQT
ncbi:MAG: hypothetical protein M1305_00565, partial [Candidatus Marsarchaeota archaeon]|nr:hypothetical protein [Candidatus Marsarchaeota archaeon]